MATRNINKKISAFTTSQIFLCVLFLFCTLIGTWGLYKFNNEVELNEKITFNILGALGLGFLVNFLTTMFFGDSKRKELAENTYDKLFIVVNQLLIKSETEKLTLNEFTLLSQLADIMGSLSKHCDINMDVINNKYERLKNNPPQYITSSPQSLYGATQVYDEYLVKHQHPPAVADSGSQAIPPSP